MSVKRRCPHCLKKLKKIGENQYVCENHTPPIYYPPLNEVEKTEAQDE